MNYARFLVIDSVAGHESGVSRRRLDVFYGVAHWLLRAAVFIRQLVFIRPGSHPEIVSNDSPTTISGLRFAFGSALGIDF